MKPNYFRRFLKGIFLMQMFIIIVVAGVSLDVDSNYLQKFSRLGFRSLLIPFVDMDFNDQQASSLFKETNYVLAGSSTDNWWNSSYLDGKMPEDIMAANIPALVYEEDNSTDTGVEDESHNIPSAITVEEETPKPAANKENYALFKGRKVVFYCTHSGESYIPDSGKARLEGKPGLINKVAGVMAKEVAQKGLSTKFVNTIHDYPDYNSSYANSRQTVKNTLSSSDNILAIFDIHRDSLPGAERAETVKIKGRTSARILMIVGTDQRKSNPHWRENLKFAQKLQVQAEKMYPGLVKAVNTKAGTYNQEFHNHGLLLEFGSDLNSLEEASYAAELFSEVLVEVLEEEIQ